VPKFNKEMAERELKKKEMPAAEHMKRAQYMMKIGNLDWAKGISPLPHPLPHKDSQEFKEAQAGSPKSRK
jgi:hypothetical protein